MTKSLQDRFPQLRLMDDADSLCTYGQDWTRFAEPAPAAVVFPASVEELSELVAYAAAEQLALVPSGGRTGLSGGAVAANGEIVVSLERMNRVLSFNADDRLVTVQAGLITEQLQNYAADQGLCYPVDFASKGSSQIGGNIATNAGGVKVLRHGNTRNWVAGLKVVTGTGEVLELNQGLVKNATGLDLRHLFVGSEGQLGFIAEATMLLGQPPQPQSVMVLAVPAMDEVMQLFSGARRRLQLSAFEFFSDLALRFVTDQGDLRRPVDEPAPFYVLLEFDCPNEAAETAALGFFEEALEQGWCLDGVLSQSEAQAQALWQLREFISERISHRTPYKNDLSVRISRVPDLLARLDALVAGRYPDFEVVWYGHIGDGNLHLNILKPEDLPVAEFQSRCEAVNGAVFAIVEELGGSVSAEHGVGLLKRPYLQYSRSGTEIDLMRGIKAVFDPAGILNPGKTLPNPGAAAPG